MNVAYSSAEETRCCLCRSSVNEGTMLVKRKVFHGKAYEVAKLLINDLLHEQWQISVMWFRR